MAGGARRVTHAGGGVLVEDLPGVIAVGLGDPCFVRHRVFQRRRRHMRGVGEHDIFLDRLELVGELFQNRHESEIDHHHAVFGVIDDPDDLFGEQARIDGVIDRAHAHDAVPGFEVAPGVPGQRRDAVALFDAVAFEPLRHAQRPRPDLDVIGGMDRPFDRPRDHLTAAVIECRVIDDAMAQQRPILHQAKHGVSPRCRQAFIGMAFVSASLFAFDCLEGYPSGAARQHVFARRRRSLKWGRFIAYLGMIFPENRFPLFGIMP